MMSEIWSLNAICRCCHADGYFKPLNSPCVIQESSETYSEMLRDTLGININLAPIDASYNICDLCIQQLRDATVFKKQVIASEIKFQEYCQNEMATFITCVKVETTAEKGSIEDFPEVKMEECSNSPDDTEHQPDTNDDDDNTTSTKGTIKKFVKPKLNKKKVKRERIRKNFTCVVCEGSFKNNMDFRKHLTDHKKPYKCQKCIMEYESYYFFKAHTLNCGLIPTKIINKDLQNIATYKCELCKKAYKHKSTLTKHILWHNGTNKKFICHTCGKSFNDVTNLKYHHIAVHEKIKPFKCTKCPNAYGSRKNLKIHYRMHTGERPYKCEICSDTFISSSNLIVHSKKHSLAPQNPNFKYICRTCYTPFTHKGLYLSHLKTHVKLKHLKCSICIKEFSCKYSLARHIVAHSGVKSHRCGTCNQEFTQKTQLIRHEKRFHSPNEIVLEKIKCKICGKNVFNMESHLKIHKNRPFACEFCDKTYPERNTLTRHMKERHCGGKPFPCSLCHKKYIKKQRLKDHMIEVHKTPLVLS